MALEPGGQPLLVDGGPARPIWRGPCALPDEPMSEVMGEHRCWVAEVDAVAATGPARSRAKRLLDCIGALALLLLVSPVLFVLIGLIHLTSPGPTLFRQRRIGLGGASFEMLKLRTMRTNAESVLRSNPHLHARYVANNFKLLPEDDPRLTRVGRLLRATSLDELPQLINVLRGHMSLVGPRPVLLEELDQYGPKVEAYLSVKPGLTGMWQVSGRSNMDYSTRVQMDVLYVEGWSLASDLKILARTPRAVLSREGAY